MAGTRQFDTDVVLDRALKVFWRNGFDGTSIDDLTNATGLGRGSLYGAFQNKETLFLTVLDRYLEGSRSKWQKALQEPEIRKAIRASLNAQIDVLTDEDAEAGCFLLLASMNAEQRSHRLRRRVLKAFADEEQALYERLRKADREGELAKGADIRALARFFVAQGRAIGLTARYSADESILNDIADTSIAVLD